MHLICTCVDVHACTRSTVLPTEVIRLRRVSRSACASLTGWTRKFGTIFLYALTLSNISRFSKLFHCLHQQEKSNINSCVLLHYLVKCHSVGADCCSVSLITPLVSGVAGLNALSSSNVETKHFDVKISGCDSYFRQ